MAEALPRRLPGVRFEVPPPDLDATLPRMDIAFFLGFATRGPLDRAVPVESLGEFEAVYGQGIVLARDHDTGEPVRGQLHPCVRAFFSQGGRRCWILRVAGADAKTSTFPVTSMLLAQRAAANEPWQLQAPLLRAGSAGSGFDAVRLSARVEARFARARPLALCQDGTLVLTVATAAAEGLQPGDVLRGSYESREVAGHGKREQHLHVHGRVLAIERDRGECHLVLGGFVALRRLGPRATLAALTVRATDGTDRGVAVPESTWAEGNLLRLRCPFPGPMPHAGEVLQLLHGERVVAWMNVTRAAVSKPAQPAGAPAELECLGTVWRRASARALLRAWASAGGERVAQVLRVQLQAREDGAGAHLSPLLRMAAGGGDRAGSIAGLADPPGFPLTSVPAAAEAMWLPLAELTDFGAAPGPVPTALAPQVRDGVAAFSWRLFSDAALAQEMSDTLADTAERLRLSTPKLRPLHGLHALFGGAGDGLVEEPTLLAVPDAVHPGWQPVTPPPLWKYDTAPPEPAGDIAARDFLDCDAAPLRPPVLHAAEEPGEGDFTLFWDEPAAGARYRVEESADASFSAASLLYEGPATRFSVLGKPPRTFHYRVRAASGRQRSGWSVPIEVQLARIGYETPPSKGHDPRQLQEAPDLLAIHRLMLRCAAARGDLLAVLSLPETFDATAAAAHACALSDPAQRGEADAPPPIGDGEIRALSHGALYHPWLLIRRVDEAIRFTPDGAVCGQLAASALRRGAWIAVAERPLRDVVAVTPATLAAPTNAQRQALLQAQVNVVRCAPHGFVPATADTLSPDPSWRPVNVRRLMCLLRRLALRRGTEYVFEPNGPTLRRTVERGFEAALDLLFRRGAFAGTKAEDAYRVEAGDEVNTAQRRDAGQFWVQLKVAPALPLSFLTVRLVREGERVVSRELH